MKTNRWLMTNVKLHMIKRQTITLIIEMFGIEHQRSLDGDEHAARGAGRSLRIRLTNVTFWVTWCLI